MSQNRCNVFHKDIEKGVRSILEQCEKEIRIILLALNRVQYRGIAQCIRTKLKNADRIIFDKFIKQDQNMNIDKETTVGFQDMILRNRKLMIGDSTDASKSGTKFLDYFRTFTAIARTKFEPVERRYEANMWERKRVEKPLVAETPRVEKPLKVNEVRVRFLIQKKKEEEEKTRMFDRLFAQCDRDVAEELKRRDDRIEEETECFMREKDRLMEEIEKRTIVLQEKVKRHEEAEKELVREHDVAESDLLMWIDKYDQEVAPFKYRLFKIAEAKFKMCQKIKKVEKKKFPLDDQLKEAEKENMSWVIEDVKKEKMLATKFVKTLLGAYVEAWKQTQPQYRKDKEQSQQHKGDEGK